VSDLRDNDRARLAWEHVSRVRQDQVEADQSKYRSIALKLPVLVHREGLAPALHFVAARGDEPKKLLLAHLARQLAGARLCTEQATAADLLRYVRELDANGTRLATAEVQRCLCWYKRFAQIELKEGKEE
jgi:CRISPR type III-B/RAMP module-associated protein Cmr5